jgi:5-methylcytosine-specific restriction endonuclease McrA
MSVLKVGDKVNRLTMLEHIGSNWKCQCECGSILLVETNKINSNAVKSCGCLVSEVSRQLVYTIHENNRKYEPCIRSARRIWEGYRRPDSECMDFDSFYPITQQSCYYCGQLPSKRFNYFLSSAHSPSQKSIDEGWFIYNGLDRIDSSIGHTVENCVPCCWTCNNAKNTMTPTQFLEQALVIKSDLIFSQYQLPKIISLPNNKPLILSLKTAWRTYSTRQKYPYDITLEQFYYLSQLNCFYCNAIPTNRINTPLNDKKASQQAKEQGWFIYNGLDRIDCSKGHILDNIVVACKFCNIAKGEMSFDEFMTWAKRIQTFQQTKRAEA